jgi:hypothetical protein
VGGPTYQRPSRRYLFSWRFPAGAPRPRSARSRR